MALHAKFLIDQAGTPYGVEDLLNPLFKGIHADLAALALAHPTAEPGSFANINAGVGQDMVRAYWDEDDAQWIEGGTGALP